MDTVHIQPPNTCTAARAGRQDAHYSSPHRRLRHADVTHARDPRGRTPQGHARGAMQPPKQTTRVFAGASSPQRCHANQKSASKMTRGPDTKTDGKRDTRRAHQPFLDPPAHRCLEKPREGLWPPRAPPHPNAPSHANAHCGREPPAAHTRPPAPSRRLASPPRLLQSPAAASRMMPGLASGAGTPRRG